MAGASPGAAGALNDRLEVAMGELERLKRDLANGRVSPDAHGLAVQRIAELERAAQQGPGRDAIVIDLADLLVVMEAAESWAEELGQWIIPGADDEEDREGYERSAARIAVALAELSKSVEKDARLRGRA